MAKGRTGLDMTVDMFDFACLISLFGRFSFELMSI